MKQFLLVLLALVTGAFITAKAGVFGPVPEGNYNCHKISGSQLIGLGTLEIRGRTYRVSEKEGFAPFSVDANGKITWSAGISFLPTGWKLTSSEYRGMVNGKPMINIHYVSGSGFSEVIDCTKE